MLDKCEVIVTRIQVQSVVLALIAEIRFGANTARAGTWDEALAD